ncbi:MAG: cytochrome C biogenesis protein [Proteobacteria bacterium]|nr:cytochrome C biogenesis protein [Pseudomonadota bacterium]
MKKNWPWLLFAVFAIEVAFSLKPRTDKPDDFQIREWSKLPVLVNGRVQPFDSVARNSLVIIRGNTDVPLEGNGADGKWGRWETLQGPLTERKWYQFDKHPAKLKPAEWLLEVFSKAELADTRPIFLIHHPELIGALKLQNKGVEKSGLRYYCFNDLKPGLDLMQGESTRIGQIKQELRTPYQRSFMNLHNGLITYLRLKSSLKPENSRDFAAEVTQLEQQLPAAIAAFKAESAGQPHDKALLEAFGEKLEMFKALSRYASLLIVPPTEPGQKKSDWVNVGDGLLGGLQERQMPVAIHAYAAMTTAYAQGQPAEFNSALADYRSFLAGKLDTEMKKGRQEALFNQFLPFYRSMMIYVVALILAAASWLNWSENLNRAAFRLVTLGLVIHTAGLVFRMFLEGRPPVTNLYSSAIFVGWGAAVLGVVLERIYRNGIGSVVASAVGFITLIIAHHLAQTSSTGDTMEMMRAVLDTNFWLATHVTSITIGYASTFLSGFLAMIYVLRGVFTRTLDEATAKSLSRMVYGIVCFATLFSFVGTILGGIWADQSWGRFWGWDPKENGALLIVVWNSLILHARWGGMVRERGLMNLALFGNIVTAWSWFGTNMLGVGLHSYGFMDAAFKWLMIFNASQLVLIVLGCLPSRYWKSGNGPQAGEPPAAGPTALKAQAG